MTLPEIINYTIGLIGFIATVIAAMLVVRSTAVKQTIAEQKDLIGILSQKVSALEEADMEKATQIESLQREVDTFKNIPLKEIVNTQKSILATQKEIIKLLGER